MHLSKFIESFCMFTDKRAGLKVYLRLQLAPGGYRSRAQLLEQHGVQLAAHAAERPGNGGDVSSVELPHNGARLGRQLCHQLGPSLPQLCQGPQRLGNLLQEQDFSCQ